MCCPSGYCKIGAMRSSWLQPGHAESAKIPYLVILVILTMDVIDLLLFLAFAALGWFWFDSLRAIEVARNAGRDVCNRAGVQFLDDTVASVALALGRDEMGRRALRRTYRFEFSDTGDNRREGCLILLGSKVESVEMEPYRLLP
jgi:hypothetical protein